MKQILSLLLFCLIISCTEKADIQPTVPQGTNERKPDPLTGGANGTVLYQTPTDWNVVWDTTFDCGTTRLLWDNQGASLYYVMIQGSGNGSCSTTIQVSGVTYYYPHKSTPVNYTALHTGQICGTMALTPYNIIILYYKFQGGKWKAYTSLPVTIWFGRPGTQC